MAPAANDDKNPAAQANDKAPSDNVNKAPAAPVNDALDKKDPVAQKPSIR